MHTDGCTDGSSFIRRRGVITARHLHASEQEGLLCRDDGVLQFPDPLGLCPLQTEAVTPDAKGEPAGYGPGYREGSKEDQNHQCVHHVSGPELERGSGRGGSCGVTPQSDESVRVVGQGGRGDETGGVQGDVGGYQEGVGGRV